jgi:hypothetical protein
MPKFEGTGPTLELAFKDAAEKAIAADKGNDHKVFQARIVSAEVANPKINEYRVEINR